MNWAALFKVWQVFQIVLKLLPIAQQIVITLGTLFPAGPGADKLAQTKVWLQTHFDQLQAAGVQFEEVWKYIEPIVAALCKRYNVEGWPDPVAPPVVTNSTGTPTA